MSVAGRADTTSPSATGKQAASEAGQGPAGAVPDAPAPGFAVALENFSGPFDVLLNLIGKHQLDITEVALSRVTDEFIGYIRALRETAGEKALEETTSFLVVASTLLDLKAARLLPTGEVESDEDIALLEARDLLFARLLQYRAFKVMAGQLSDRLADESGRYPRKVALEPGFAALLPELVFTTDAQALAALARKAMEPKPVEPTEVGVGHLHAPAVSVREQAALLAGWLSGNGPATFAELVADADETMVVIARFLALLEMFRDKYVGFEQAGPLGELVVSWNPQAGAWEQGRVVEEYEHDGRDNDTQDTAADAAGEPKEQQP